VGLLVFLFFDTLAEALEIVAGTAGVFGGAPLVFMVALLSFLLLLAVGARRKGANSSKLGISYRIALGIGLHNLGEGLAIGAALGLGEVALGRLLILGFTLHNTTEGLAIIAPIARTPVSLGRLLFLGLIGSLPTIAGAWLGGFVYSPTLSVLFLALGAGAIAQVIVQISKGMAAGRPLADALRSGPVMAGLLAGFALMYTTGMLIQ